MKVENLDNLLAKLRKLSADAEAVNKASVTVGFSQSYAIYVHEDLDAAHAEGKVAKYLEGPARRLGDEIGKLIGKAYQQSKDIEASLLIGGLRLQREAQQIVPIDTSALKASAYTSQTRDEDAAFQSAFQKSEAIRLGELDRRERAKAKAQAAKKK